MKMWRSPTISFVPGSRSTSRSVERDSSKERCSPTFPVSHFIVEKALSAKGFKPNDNDTYLYKMVGMQMVWPYDDRGRLLGEYQWEPEPSKAEIFKLAPEDVLTTEESGKLLAPFIKPLPSYDEMVLGKRSVSAA